MIRIRAKVVTVEEAMCLRPLFLAQLKELF